MSQVSDFELCNLAYGGHEPLINTRLEEEPNSVDRQDNGGRTALHWASCTNNIDIAKLLISRFNARVNIRDEMGWTALHCATSSGSDEITEILLAAGASGKHFYDVTCQAVQRNRLMDRFFFHEFLIQTGSMNRPVLQTGR